MAQSRDITVNIKVRRDGKFRVGELVQAVLPDDAKIGLHSLENISVEFYAPGSGVLQLLSGEVGKVHFVHTNPITYAVYYTVEFAMSYPWTEKLLYAVLPSHLLISAENPDFTPRETTHYRRTRDGEEGTMEHQHNVPGYHAYLGDTIESRYFIHSHSHGGYHSHSLEELGV